MDRGRSRYWASSKGSTRCDALATWEERAFAVDSAGDLGSVWPPRSYSCSFCGREFRSAQALGGHMNVHRRDRARLKQSQSSQSDEEEQIATDRHDKDGSLSSSLMLFRLDSDRSTVPRVLSGSLLSDKRSWSQLVWKQEENKRNSLLGSRSSVYPTIVEAMSNISDTDHGDKLRCIDRPAPTKYRIEEAMSYKRAKISDSCKLPRFLVDQFFTEDYSRKSGVTGVEVGPREELDLELRLGSPPLRSEVESRV